MEDHQWVDVAGGGLRTVAGPAAGGGPKTAGSATAAAAAAADTAPSTAVAAVGTTAVDAAAGGTFAVAALGTGDGLDNSAAGTVAAAGIITDVMIFHRILTPHSLMIFLQQWQRNLLQQE